MTKQRKSKTGKVWLIILLVLVLGGSVAGYVGYRYYRMIFAPNVVLEQKEVFFHVPTGSNAVDVKEKLAREGIIKREKGFAWVSEQKNYASHVHPGRYRIRNGMSNSELVDLLRSGEQVPVQVSFHGIRTKTELAGKVTHQVEADSLSMLRLLRDPQFVVEYGFDTTDVLTMFIPNTYELYWNTSAEGLFERMHQEYERFWTEERRQKASSLGLSPKEVSILASIVQAEQKKHPDERPRVAELYLNRLERGMKLQSDPTLIYAMGDFSVQRVLNKDKEVDSPYNTYRYKGLPPGPIELPEVSSLKAVLNPEEHDHLFMCAKPDSSGYHNFARTLRQHNAYAREYRRWLNESGILR